MPDIWPNLNTFFFIFDLFLKVALKQFFTVPLIGDALSAWETHSHAALVEGEVHILNFILQCKNRKTSFIKQYNNQN